VVDRDAVVKAALLIEVEHLFDRKGRLRLSHVIEGTTIAKRGKARPALVV